MSNLDMIFGKQASDNAIDPVCGMTVSKVSPRGGSTEFNGETYYFCAVGCRSAFIADPEKFLNGGGGDHSHMGHHHS